MIGKNESLVFAGVLPGLPHLLKEHRSPGWERLASGMALLGECLREAKPDVIVLYSTQWLSVLGTSVQTHPNPRGTHVDENWYEWGDLDFDFKSDVALGGAIAAGVRENGLPAKTVAFDEFPIDTGSIVALRFLDPSGSIPVSIVSSWVYADADKSRAIGRICRERCAAEGRRAAFIGCTLLSARFTPRDIDPETDAIPPDDDAQNRRVLGYYEAGDAEGLRSALPGYLGAAKPDMGFNAFHWLDGALGGPGRARIHAYGPIWGTGAAVMELMS